MWRFMLGFWLLLSAQMSFSGERAVEQPLPPMAVFVSFSMPEPLFKQTLEQASAMKIPVVLRGLLDNNFRKTAQKLFELSKETNTGGVVINPLWFRSLHIEQVPSVLFEGRVLSGSLSLESALLHLKEGDEGKFGTTFPVQEEDFLEHLSTIIQAKQKSGEWDTLQQDFVERAQFRSERPKGIKLPVAESSKTRDYDPSVVIREDIVGLSGEVLIKDGTQVNPLHTIALSSTLIFIDGDDQDQVEWLKIHREDYPKLKVILVNGDVKVLSQNLSQRVYFDQGSALTQKFSLQALPSVVCQAKGPDGALLPLLRIEEVDPKENHHA